MQSHPVPIPLIPQFQPAIGVTSLDPFCSEHRCYERVIMAASGTPAVARPPRSALTTRGFFKRWEVEYYEGATLSVPSEAAATSQANTPAEVDAAALQLRKQDFYILHCKDSTISLPNKVKGIKLELCERCTIHVPSGTVGTVELQKCKRVTIKVDRPVSGVKVDECDDVTIEASWEARVGFLDDSIVPDPEEQTSASSESANGTDDGGDSDIDRRPVRTTGVGLHVVSTGSHAITLRYPASPHQDSVRYEKLLPDTLYTVLRADEDWPKTSVVHHGSWGRDTGAVRRPAAAAGAGGAGTESTQPP